MRDRLKRVIYVGKARDLRKRLSHYFTPSRQMRADPKTRALIDSIWEFEWHIVRSEAEAVLYEGRLIKEFRPKYNVSFRDDKRFLLVRVNPNDPWPKFQLTRLRKDDGARYFGPFAHSGALRTTLSAIRKKFGIRSCRPLMPGERDYRHCLDHIIKNCSAPCIGKIAQTDYLRRVEEACEFLDGESRQMIEQVETEMKSAARETRFREGGRTAQSSRRSQAHDQADDSLYTQGAAGRHRPAGRSRARWRMPFNSARPPRIMECFDISNISSTHIVASMVRFKDGVPDRANYRRYRIRGTPDSGRFRQYGRGGKKALLAGASRGASGRNDRSRTATTATVDYSPEFSQQSPRRSLHQLLKPSTINHPACRI